MPDFDLAVVRGDDAELPFVVREPTATLTTLGTPTGGTFTLSYGGYETAPIAFNASAAAVEAALEGLPSIPDGAVACAGGALPTAVVITFSGLLAGADPADIEADGALLTGGTSAEAEVKATRANITAWTPMWFTAKRSLTDTDAQAVMQLTLAGGGISKTSPSTGEGKVILTPASYPASLPYDRPTVLCADLQAVDASSKVRTLCSGRLTILPEATRSNS